jgi:pimeloyl-ACP methyl ester carboxylesterase
MWLSSHPRRWSLVVLLVVVAAAGCTSPASQPAASSKSSSSPSGSGQALPEPGVNCPDVAKQGQPVRFGAAGATNLAGILVGKGPNGVVLVPPDVGNLCTWLPYGLGLAQLGYRVLAFDLPSHGASGPHSGGNDAATATATDWLRSQGASRIFLIGALEGATFATMAAAEIEPPVNGLVSLSPPLRYNGLDAHQALHGLLVPAMFIAADLIDSDREDAEALFNAMPTEGVLHQLLSVPATTDRGVLLLQVAVPNGGARGDTVHGQIESFLGALTSTS